MVLEVLTGAKSSARVCHEHGIRGSMLPCWRWEFIEHPPENPWNKVSHSTGQVFECGKAQNQSEERICELERMVGRLTMELEISKQPRCCSDHHGTETGAGRHAEPSGELSSDQGV